MSLTLSEIKPAIACLCIFPNHLSFSESIIIWNFILWNIKFLTALSFYRSGLYPIISIEWYRCICHTLKASFILKPKEFQLDIVLNKRCESVLIDHINGTYKWGDCPQFLLCHMNDVAFLFSTIFISCGRFGMRVRLIFFFFGAYRN